MSGRTNNISSYFNITNYISTTHNNVCLLTGIKVQVVLFMMVKYITMF